MDGGASHNSLVQQMMGRIPNWWSMDNLKPVSQEISAYSFLSPNSSSLSLSSSSSSSSYNSSPSSSSLLPNYSKQILTNLCPMTPWHHNQQLLLGGVEEEDAATSFAPYDHSRKIDDWDDQHQMTYSSSNNYMVDIKQDQASGNIGYAYNYYGDQQQDQNQASRSPWIQATAIRSASSPRSCITTSYNKSNMLDFSNCKAQRKQQQPDHFTECNSTAIKKPKLQASTTAQSPFKVRKEKLGDRITALHQLVSPFGKTDTASVLLEAIGYIRFLQSQIEALSSPYLANGSRKMRHKLLNENCLKKIGPPHDQDADKCEPSKDLRSKGLCLVPMTFTMHVGNDHHNGADFWSPNFGSGF